MAASDVKLLGIRPSPFVNRVQFALNLKSVDYEFLLENYPAKSGLLLKSNPVHKKIPVLIHGDKPLCESLVIVEYIDEVWSDGPSILPADPYLRATARFWAAYIDDKLLSVLMSLNKAKEEERASVLEKTGEVLALLEDVLVKTSGDGDGKGFFGGETLGYLDIALGSMVGWVRTLEASLNVKIIEDETKTPALQKWAHKFASHPAVKGTLLETEELLEFLRVAQAQMAADAAAKASK